MNGFRFLSIAMFFGGLLGCASMKVSDRVDEVGAEVPGHTEWWDDSIPRVLMLPRVCSGENPVFQLPGPMPSVFLEVDWAEKTALFHDTPPACVEAAQVSDSLRIVVSRWRIALRGNDSVQLDGRFSRADPDEIWYRLGTSEKLDAMEVPDGVKDPRYLCTSGATCLREGANLRWRSDTGVVQLQVVERLHPERTPWAIHERRVRSLGYLVSVPIDIVLSPFYLVGGIILLIGLRDFNPWH
ncbi:MAG: hypothetical protein H6686_06400 [Fibrobacteria bacterium]|nr:hypothetical protein [Fibrobacteria bacterium]